MPPRTFRPPSSWRTWTRFGAVDPARAGDGAREPDLNERQLHARRRVHEAMQRLGGISSPAASCVWHVVGLQLSVRAWAIRQGWVDGP
jgi:hypothetical protein